MNDIGAEAAPHPAAGIGVWPVFHTLDQAVARGPRLRHMDFYGRSFRYAETGRFVERFAAGLQALGVGKGVRVGLFLPNCPHYVIAYYAILKAGGTVVNFSPLYSVPELVHQVEDSQTDILVCLDAKALYETARQVLERSRLNRLIVGSIADMLPLGKAMIYRMFRRREVCAVTPDERHVSFRALLACRAQLRLPDIDPLRDVALLQYTGGTTGVPKGAMLSHANLVVNAQQASSNLEPTYGTIRVFAALPFFHIFANTAIVNQVTLVGGEIVMVPKFELAGALKTMRRRRVTILPAVPTMFTALLKANAPAALASLDYCISGGAPLPVELKSAFEQQTGSRILEGYGLTECAGIAAVNPRIGVAKTGSVGMPIAGTRIVIVDKDDPSRILPQGETGEVCISGPQVMLGYWRKPEATAEVLGLGYLRTGDLGYLDADGYLFIVDRMKDMITVGGFKVFPRHVEDALYEQGDVLEASVIGVADAYLGQRPKAFVVLKESARQSVTADVLQAFLKQRLGKHEVPAAIEIRDSLPKTLVGKLSKKELVAEEAARAGANQGKETE